jgi:hypothetical protein
MDAVEDAARVRSERTLGVQTSITAQPFYPGRGFTVVRESLYREERTIVMSKDIPVKSIDGHSSPARWPAMTRLAKFLSDIDTMRWSDCSGALVIYEIVPVDAGVAAGWAAAA